MPEPSDSTDSAHIMTTNDAGIMITAAAVPTLRAFWGHDLRWWRDVANVVMVWFLIIGAVGAAGVVVSTKLALDWSAEIEKFDGDAVDLKVAEANKAGVEAGEKASLAQSGLDAANVEIAKQKTLTAQAQLETERLKKQLAWRALLPAQAGALTRALSNQSLSASFWVPVLDPEVMALRDQILQASALAGVNISDGGTDLTINRLPFDAAVRGRPAAISRWAYALEKAGLTVFVESADEDTKVYIMPKSRP